MSNNLTFPLRQLIGTAQEHSDHLLVALDALKRLIPELDDRNCEAGAFFQMIITHEQYHSDHVRRELQAIDSVPSLKQVA